MWSSSGTVDLFTKVLTQLHQLHKLCEQLAPTDVMYLLTKLVPSPAKDPSCHMAPHAPLVPYMRRSRNESVR